MFRRRQHESLVVEVTQRCNHACGHCYNVWKGPRPYPEGEMDTERTLAMLRKVLDESRATMVALSGGEPLLREDIHEIIDFLVARGVTVNLLTNGSLVDDATIARLGDKIDLYEIPLLSVDRDIHDRMTGVAGSFDRATLAVASLKAAGQHVVCVFVATALNVHTWPEAAKLMMALGADGIMFNRFNPGGEGLKHLDELIAAPELLQAAMDEAEAVAAEYGIGVACSIAMPPCLFDTDRYEHLGFGFCAAGTERAYYTVDPLGNLRPCNHSPTILGNVAEAAFWDMVDSPALADFVAARPEFCGGCSMESECLGGCKAAAEAQCGSAWGCDPYLAAFVDRAIRPG